MTARFPAVRCICRRDDRMPIYLGKYYDRKEFPEGGIVEVIIRSDTIRGVEYCHAHGIVDRDTGARLGAVVDEKSGATIGAVMAAGQKRMTKESV